MKESYFKKQENLDKLFLGLSITFISLGILFCVIVMLPVNPIYFAFEIPFFGCVSLIFSYLCYKRELKHNVVLLSFSSIVIILGVIISALTIFMFLAMKGGAS